MLTLGGQIYAPNGLDLVTAVAGGGLGGTPPPGGVALQTDRRVADVWETFRVILQPGSPPLGTGMRFALQTSGGQYLTAVNAGGVGGRDDATCPIHTDAGTAALWEGFTLEIDDTVHPPTARIKTETGNYVTAVNGGGINGGADQPIHSDAVAIGPWEQFLFLGLVEGPTAAAPSINISFIPSINVNGTVNLVMNSDGTYSFSCHFNNGNYLPFTVAVVVVVNIGGNAFRFAASGNYAHKLDS